MWLFFATLAVCALFVWYWRSLIRMSVGLLFLYWIKTIFQYLKTYDAFEGISLLLSVFILLAVAIVLELIDEHERLEAQEPEVANLTGTVSPDCEKSKNLKREESFFIK